MEFTTVIPYLHTRTLAPLPVRAKELCRQFLDRWIRAVIRYQPLLALFVLSPPLVPGICILSILLPGWKALTGTPARARRFRRRKPMEFTNIIPYLHTRALASFPLRVKGLHRHLNDRWI